MKPKTMKSVLAASAMLLLLALTMIGAKSTGNLKECEAQANNQNETPLI